MNEIMSWCLNRKYELTFNRQGHVADGVIEKYEIKIITSYPICFTITIFNESILNALMVIRGLIKHRLTGAEMSFLYVYKYGKVAILEKKKKKGIF